MRRLVRSVVTFVLAIGVLSPVVALALAFMFDRGPDGETRVLPHFFAIVLWLFDDFAWTCTRNSLIFASLVSLLSLGLGTALGWVVAGRRFWGRGILHGMIVASLVVAPAFLALGLRDSWSPLRTWALPVLGVAGSTGRAGLESWRGLPLWIAWLWSSLPWAVSLVTVVTAAAVEQLEPSWEDAARLAGAGKVRAWWRLSWPLVRPASARASALVFAFALAEPGAPLVLGLRRTLAFQIVEAAWRPDPFPQAAVWAFMTGLFGLIGWIVWRWAGRTPILDRPRNAPPRRDSSQVPRVASPARAIASTMVLASWLFLAWLPIVGLLRLALGDTRVLQIATGGAMRHFVERIRWLGEPPASTIFVNSALLGLEVATAALVFAWYRPSARRAFSKLSLAGRFARRLALVPPLVQGLGLLALPCLAGLASAIWAGRGRYEAMASALNWISTGLDPLRNPWIMLSCAVALALAPRFLVLWQTEAHADSRRGKPSSAVDAAFITGASRLRAMRLGKTFPLASPIAGCFLVWSIAATNLTPALLFEPWIDGQTIAPAVLHLAAGPANARAQAALLALCAIACNLAALAVARGTSALTDDGSCCRDPSTARPIVE